MELIALFTVTALAALALQMADAQLATDEKENCFARVDEAEWPAQEVLRFNASEAAVVFDLRGASRGLRECLEADGRAYQVVILRDGRVFGAAELDSSSGEEGNSTAAAVTRFAYAVLPGVYSARLRCDGCSEEVTSHPVNVVGEDCDAVRVPPSVAVEQQGRAHVCDSGYLERASCAMKLDTYKIYLLGRDFLLFSKLGICGTLCTDLTCLKRLGCLNAVSFRLLPLIGDSCILRQKILGISEYRIRGVQFNPIPCEHWP